MAFVGAKLVNYIRMWWITVPVPFMSLRVALISATVPGNIVFLFAMFLMTFYNIFSNFYNICFYL